LIIKMSNSLKNERGASAVELAFIMPLLFLLVFGIVWFGWSFARWQSVVHAAREGVRLMALGEGKADAEARAEASAPVAGTTMLCEGTGDEAGVEEVQMECRVSYPPRLYVFGRDACDMDPANEPNNCLSSLARMKKEGT